MALKGIRRGIKKELYPLPCRFPQELYGNPPRNGLEPEDRGEKQRLCIPFVDICLLIRGKILGKINQIQSFEYFAFPKKLIQCNSKS